MANFTVIFDACVLYPAPLRDTLLHLALTDLFKARWTDQIHEEWINALLRTGKFTREQLEWVRDLMDRHTRDARVTGYESLIDGITLPDPKDRHVVAAAIKSNADAIVTMNLKDFPEDILKAYDIDVLHPDDFIDLPPTTNPVHKLVSSGNHCKTAAVGNTNGSGFAMVA